MFCKLSGWQEVGNLLAGKRLSDAVNVKENIRQDFLVGGGGGGRVAGVGGLRMRVASRLAPDLFDKDTTEKTTQ